MFNTRRKILEDNIIYRTSIFQAIVIWVLGAGLTWVMLWVTNWILVYADSSFTNMDVFWAALTLGMATALNHCVFSRYQYTGTLCALGESLGFTTAFAVFFSPLPPQGVLLMFLGFTAVSHLSGIVRVARLKKLGYTDMVDKTVRST